MEEAKIITVSGFSFENPEVGEDALKEQEAIEYIDKQLDLNDTKAVLTLYNQMVARRMFHTQVGFAYLKRIQDYLMESDIDPAVIESIPISYEYSSEIPDNISSNTSKDKPGKSSNGNEKSSDKKEIVKLKNKEKKTKLQLKKYQRLFITFLTIAIVLVVTVVAMFIISNTSNNPTILNYEEVLQNKYASWEQDLERREAELNRSKRNNQ